VHESVILSSLYAVPGVARVQVIQAGQRHSCCGLSTTSQARTIASPRRGARVASALAFDGDVTVRTRAFAPSCEPSGKIKSVVSLLRHPAASTAGCATLPSPRGGLSRDRTRHRQGERPWLSCMGLGTTGRRCLPTEGASRRKSHHRDLRRAAPGVLGQDDASASWRWRCSSTPPARSLGTSC